MSYNTFSNHAPTGINGDYRFTASPNQYAPEGRLIGYPYSLTVYVNSISDIDGSVSVSEVHTADQVVGSRLYLYHRPMIDATGGVGTINTSEGTIIAQNTNAKQGFVEFSSDPTGTFTVSYTAAPDCVNVWHINKMQDDIMEIEKKVGPNTLSAETGQGYNLRNTATFVNDKPNDGLTSLMGNYLSMGHLKSDIRISSSDDSNLTGTLGDHRLIQIGREKDSVYIDATGIVLESTYGPATKTNIKLGTQTGDRIEYFGSFSGAGQMTVGGAEWTSIYSGVMTTGVAYVYTGAALRVHGDIACLGDIKTVGSIVVENVTGETSSIIGDFKVTDELFVYGISHLIGPVDANAVTINRDLTVHGDILAGNTRGQGGGGQTLFDNLDPSEIALSYKAVTRKNINKGVIAAPKYKNNYPPKRYIYGPDYIIGPENTCGDVFASTGILTAAVSTSGSHESIFQLDFTSNLQGFVTGKFSPYYGTGSASGVISEGLLDPGSLWIQVLDGPAAGYSAPIYSFTVEQKTEKDLIKLNVFTPQQPATPNDAFDGFMIYSPGCEPYDYISYNGGANASFQVTSTAADPLWIAFGDEVRVLTSNTATINMDQALMRSISGNFASAAIEVTGCAYIVASSNGVDPESAPTFKARATPFTLPGEALIGEVTAGWSGSVWHIKEGTSYRPGGYYDSSWIPVMTDSLIPTTQWTSGRVTPSLDTANATGALRLYFNHELGADMDFARMNADLYVASHNTNSYTNQVNKLHAFAHSLFGQDAQHGVNDGTFNKVSLTEKSSDFARIFYIDGKVIGIEVETPVIGTNDYIRLVVNRKDQ